MSRLAAARTASRPKMNGRAMISGPSGAGKTWTALSMGRVLAEGDLSKVLYVDTERESALTYADVFAGFVHLPWRAPYDADELAATLAEISADTFRVVVIDSFSHFWRGSGGVLDIADGRIGGWKTARPVQDRIVEAVLSVPAHVFLCVRSKMDYLVEDGGKRVTKLGVAPIQDDTLVYEMNIALDIDLEHRITVTKSRTPAVPVGRMYPAGYEIKAAQDYDGWLAGGQPPAGRDDVQWVLDRFATIPEKIDRADAKAEFVTMFGSPHALTEDKVVDARAWVLARLDALGVDPGTEPGQHEPVTGGEIDGAGSGCSVDTTSTGEPAPSTEVDAGESADGDDAAGVKAGATSPASAPPDDGPAPPRSMTTAQSKRLHACLRKMDPPVTGPDRHPWASGYLGRPIASFSELTVEDAARLIDIAEAETADEPEGDPASEES